MKSVALTAALVLLATACGKESQPRSAQDRERSGAAEVGAEVGGALDEAARGTGEAAQDAAEGMGLSEAHRYRCPTGEEFSVEFKNEGRAALVEKGNRQYWLELEEGTGRFSSRYGQFWTIDDEVATLELSGEPPMRNCERL
jgi:hypothetical protein